MEVAIVVVCIVGPEVPISAGQSRYRAVCPPETFFFPALRNNSKWKIMVNGN